MRSLLRDEIAASRRSTPTTQTLFAADLFGDLDPITPPDARDYAPGLILTFIIAAAASFAGTATGASSALFALVAGLGLNFLRSDRRLAPGLQFSSRTLLRIAIVMLGTRVTLSSFYDLGPWPFAVLLAVMATTMLFAAVGARLLGLNSSLGLLAGGAVAICGASAALALSTVVGRGRDVTRELTLVLVAVAGASAFAAISYPLLLRELGYGDVRAGFILGASIHDAAQAIAAGFAYSSAAGEVATIVKLTRVVMLAPILMVVAGLTNAGKHRLRIVLPPWFILAFFIVCGVNSTGILPAAVITGSHAASSGLLNIAIAAAAVQSPLSALRASDYRGLLLVLATTVIALLAAASASLLIGG